MFNKGADKMLRDYRKARPYSYLQAPDDQLYTAKWGNRIQLLDLNDESLEPFDDMHFALIGFKSDKGVYINNGRPGAVEGPREIRYQLAKLPWHLGRDVLVYDCGDIDGPNRTMEDLQDSLSAAVEHVMSLNLFPIVIGGGHETAFGHYQGLKKGLEASKPDLGVVNFDVHFDLRPYDKSGPNSGTGFRQMHDLNKKLDDYFKYIVLGIQEHSNNLNLFNFVAKTDNIDFLTSQDLFKADYQTVRDWVDNQIADMEKIYLTIDMDSFNSAFAPGVSAIQSLGNDPQMTLAIIEHIAATGKVVGFDLVETSPSHDIDNHTSNLAATYIFYLTQIIAKNYR